MSGAHAFFKMPFVLASSSLRRKKLFASLARHFSVRPAPEPKIHASMWERQSVPKIVERLARFKAMWAALRSPPAVVVGADTLIYARGRRLGKPLKKEEARRMLRLISGQKIEAYTGMCVIVPKKGGKFALVSWHEKADVTFRVLNKKEIERYLRTKKWVGKAGAFNILQKPARGWVAKIRGDADTVAGLPLGRLKRRLAFYANRGN